MRGLAWFVTLMKTVAAVVALAAPLSVLPGIPVIPDGTDVKVVSNPNVQTVFASGMVKNHALVLSTKNGELDVVEKVYVWLGVPTGNGSDSRVIKSLSGMTSANGNDILIEVGKDRVSFTQLLKEAYGIRLELR